jgi:hypothetical protein
MRGCNKPATDTETVNAVWPSLFAIKIFYNGMHLKYVKISYTDKGENI